VPWYRRKGFFNLPMLITLVRVAMVPVMVALLWNTPSPPVAALAMLLFVAAMIGDVVDGWLARKWELQSVAGAFLDPLADKMMVLAALVMMIPLGWVSAWVVVVLEVREIAVSGVRQLAMSEDLVIAAGSLGKFKTAYQATAIGFLLFHYDFHGLCDTQSVGTALLWISVLFSVASGIEYAWGYGVHHRARKAGS
jgi:CDP-diacylglycerol--glycerol-3-phosphate 3-phosphatidyltransferase